MSIVALLKHPLKAMRLLFSWAKARPKHSIGMLALFLVAYYFSLPDPLFSDPVCTVMEDRNGELLGARIADDGQWRFPEADSVPEKFEAAIIAYEDKRFRYHFGIDPLAICRAIYLNIKNLSVVSGGSTLTMQTIRLARKGQGRTLFEKAIEAFLATRLEFRHSKDEILALYASHAPFGGNVVGIDAASWKYFGRSASNLSWAEAATLAVLPNSPALIHPGRNRQRLEEKRNTLLHRLLEQGTIDSLTYELALLEGLPQAPMPLPMLAPHLLDREQLQQGKIRTEKPAIIQTTLDWRMQQQASRAVARHYQHLKGNGIYNACALVIEVETGDVLAYVGNTPCEDEGCGASVDIITAPRSTGSILKPFLYASMLHEGEILPNTLMPDVPSQYAGYTPKNYNLTYDGALPAGEALARSLNVPFVGMLSKHGVPKFHAFLKRMGMSTLRFAPSHYGLTLVLGGAEATLWDLGGMYASMARTLRYYGTYSGRYDPRGFRPLNYQKNKSIYPLNYVDRGQLVESAPVSAAAIWHTFNSMVDVARPGEESFWRSFQSSGRVAWKTGTSFGFRDAWAIGCTPRYVVAVWVGNATGEGRPNLVGLMAAAPLMFDIFNALPTHREWFDEPYDDMAQVPLCKRSGYRAGEFCEADSAWVPKAGLQAGVCPYHRMMHLDPTGKWRVHSDCANPLDMVHRPFFILPPSQEGYYKSKNPDYETVPPYRNDCLANLLEGAQGNMELVYPKVNTQIYVPIGLDGKPSATVFEVAHRQPEMKIFWHLDGQFVAETARFHELALNPSPGKHTLVLVDATGERLERHFEILERGQ